MSIEDYAIAATSEARGSLSSSPCDIWNKQKPCWVPSFQRMLSRSFRCLMMEKAKLQDVWLLEHLLEHFGAASMDIMIWTSTPVFEIVVQTQVVSYDYTANTRFDPTYQHSLEE